MRRAEYHHSKVAEYRRKANKAIHKTEGLFGRNPRAMLVALFFTAADAITLFVLWESFLAAQSGLFLFLLVLTMAVCLDIPMSIAGGMIKSCTQKLTDKKATMAITALALAAFLLVFIPNGYFRMNTRDTLIGSDDGLEGMEEMTVTAEGEGVTETEAPEAEAEEDGLKPAGWLMVLLPLATSICSFVCGYQLSDPLDDKLFILDDQIVDHENYITEVEAEIAEVGEDMEVYMEQKRAFEQDALNAFIGRLDSQRTVLKEAVRVLVMEAAGDPDAISRIEENARQLLEKKGVELKVLTVEDDQIMPAKNIA